MFRDYRPEGFTVTDEIVDIVSGTDEPTGLTGLFGNLEYEPAPYTLELYTGAGKTGTGYTIANGGLLLNGTVDANKILLADYARGLIQCGASVTTTPLYATYTAKGTNLRALELNQSIYCRDIVFPLPGSWVENKIYVKNITYPVKVKIEDVTIFCHYPPSGGNCLVRVQDSIAGTNYQDVTILATSDVSSAFTGSLYIPTSGMIVVKMTSTVNGAGEGWIRIRLGANRRF